MRKKLLKSILCSVMLFAIGAVTPSHAKGKPNKMQLCHMNGNGEYKLLNLSQRGYLNHMLKHDHDMDATNGACTGVVTYELGGPGPAGGIVFSLSADGTSGLEAAPADLPGMTSWQQAIADAMSLTVNGYSDWYIGDRQEMSLLQNYYVAAGIMPTYYWTSDENATVPGTAYYHNFSNNFQNYTPKIAGLTRAHAIRAF